MLKRNCIPVSSSCVLWDGGDIECIGVCKGDSVEDILTKLANYVCNYSPGCCPVTAQDLEGIEFTCFVPGYSPNTPFIDAHNIYEFLEQICAWMYSFYYINANPDTNKTILALPERLYYTEDGDEVHSLPITQYVVYLANKLCEIIATQESQQTEIEQLQADVEDLQDQIDNLPTPKAPDLYITSGCASAPNPNEKVEITKAFEALEEYFCNYISVLGSTTEWTTALGRTCAGLAASDQLCDSDHTMSELLGWIASPTTVADNYNNLWLTICDMRAAIATYITAITSLTCILAMPEDLAIDAISVTDATVSWSPSGLSGIQPPIGYQLKVYLCSGITPIGSPIFSGSYSSSTTSASIASAYITATDNYMVKLNAVYPCGESEYTSVIGKLKTALILAKVNITDESTDDYWRDTVDCTDDGGTVTYDVYHRKTTASLVSASTGLPIANSTLAPIVVRLRYTVDSCGITGASDTVLITIPIGDSEGTYDYIAQTVVNCADDEGCVPILRVLTCGISISDANTEFGTGISQCV